MSRPLRCAVIGGGIIGVAVARELINQLDGASVTVYEKEEDSPITRRATTPEWCMRASTTNPAA